MGSYSSAWGSLSWSRICSWPREYLIAWRTILSLVRGGARARGCWVCAGEKRKKIIKPQVVCVCNGCPICEAQCEVDATECEKVSPALQGWWGGLARGRRCAGGAWRAGKGRCMTSRLGGWIENSPGCLSWTFSTSRYLTILKNFGIIGLIICLPLNRRETELS